LEKTWRDTFLAYSTLPEHRQAVEEAHAIIEKALRCHRQPYVAFSGGKDSTCVLHLVLQHRRDALVWHWDYGPYLMPRELERTILANAFRLGARRLRVTTTMRYWRGDKEGVFVPALFGHVLPALAREGYDLAFVGLRMEESSKRRRRIQAQRSYGVIEECWPIATWTWMDVWAYIVSQKLPYPEVYDTLAPLVGYDRARLSTFHDPEFRDRAMATDGVLFWRWRHKPPSSMGSMLRS
jgi:hypothetical protein